MCEVRSIAECEKRVFITTNNNKIFSTGWLEPNEDEIYARKEKLIKSKGLTDDDILSISINNKKKSDTVYISAHAQDRLKERNGWNLKTSIRMIKKVYDNGIWNENNKGEVKRYINNMRKQKGLKNTDYVTYGQNLYIFKNKILVTVFPAPKTKKAAMVF